MPICLDYTSRIDPGLLKAAGVSTVCRYLSWLYKWGGVTHSTVNPKIIRQPEYDELLAAGIDVILNWEYDSRDWMGGKLSGQLHAAEAVRQAQSLGHPAGGVIVGSADFDMTRSEWAAAGAAYAVAFEAGVRTAGFTPGVYGPYDVLTWCRDDTGIEVFWQAGMSTAWSQKRNALPWPGAQLRQRSTRTIGGQVADWSDILGRIDVALTFREKADIARLVLTASSYSEGYAAAQGKEYADLQELAADGTLKRIEQDVQAISGVDLDALAAKVAVQLAPLVPTAAQVAAQIIQQLGQK